MKNSTLTIEEWKAEQNKQVSEQADKRTNVDAFTQFLSMNAGMSQPWLVAAQ
ncbi:MAG: hypothetical protein NVS4B1_35680 [Ktedonobacteraceae bacterium]